MTAALSKEARKLTSSKEILLWMTPSEAPRALQAGVDSWESGVRNHPWSVKLKESLEKRSCASTDPISADLWAKALPPKLSSKFEQKVGSRCFCATVAQNVSERIIILYVLLESMAERIGTLLERIGTYHQTSALLERREERIGTWLERIRTYHTITKTLAERIRT